MGVLLVLTEMKDLEVSFREIHMDGRPMLRSKNRHLSVFRLIGLKSPLRVRRRPKLWPKSGEKSSFLCLLRLYKDKKTPSHIQGMAIIKLKRVFF